MMMPFPHLVGVTMMPMRTVARRFCTPRVRDENPYRVYHDEQRASTSFWRSDRQPFDAGYNANGQYHRINQHRERYEGTRGPPGSENTGEKVSTTFVGMRDWQREQTAEMEKREVRGTPEWNRRAPRRNWAHVMALLRQLHPSNSHTGAKSALAWHHPMKPPQYVATYALPHDYTTTTTTPTSHTTSLSSMPYSNTNNNNNNNGRAHQRHNAMENRRVIFVLELSRSMALLTDSLTSTATLPLITELLQLHITLGVPMPTEEEAEDATQLGLNRMPRDIPTMNRSSRLPVSIDDDNDADAYNDSADSDVRNNNNDTIINNKYSKNNTNNNNNNNNKSNNSERDDEKTERRRSNEGRKDDGDDVHRISKGSSGGDSRCSGSSGGGWNIQKDNRNSQVGSSCATHAMAKKKSSVQPWQLQEQRAVRGRYSTPNRSSSSSSYKPHHYAFHSSSSSSSSLTKQASKFKISRVGEQETDEVEGDNDESEEGDEEDGDQEDEEDEDNADSHSHSTTTTTTPTAHNPLLVSSSNTNTMQKIGSENKSSLHVRTSISVRAPSSPASASSSSSSSPSHAGARIVEGHTTLTPNQCSTADRQRTFLLSVLHHLHSTFFEHQEQPTALSTSSTATTTTPSPVAVGASPARTTHHTADNTPALPTTTTTTGTSRSTANIAPEGVTGGAAVQASLEHKRDNTMSILSALAGGVQFAKGQREDVITLSNATRSLLERMQKLQQRQQCTESNADSPTAVVAVGPHDTQDIVLSNNAGHHHHQHAMWKPQHFDRILSTFLSLAVSREALTVDDVADRWPAFRHLLYDEQQAKEEETSVPPHTDNLPLQLEGQC